MQHSPESITFPSTTLQTMQGATAITLPQRLATYQGYWEDDEPTAWQLAAIGHVYDRPPLEAFEEGSRCVCCSKFVLREISVRVLQGPLSAICSAAEAREGVREAGLVFHHPRCDRLQTHVPLNLQADYSGVYGMHHVRYLFEARSTAGALAHRRRGRAGVRHVQRSSLFSLPTEIRLQIYAMVMPVMDSQTTIVPLNGESGRIVTAMGANKTGPRDMTKTNLLSTCKAVHEEALDLLFSNVTYRFAYSKTLYLFLRHIGAHGRQLLTSVDVHCASRDDAITFALMASCARLRKLTIRLPRSQLLPPRPPLWTMEGVASLLELSGLEEVRFGTCATPYPFDEHNTDAAALRRQLTRPRHEPGWVRWVDGFPEIGPATSATTPPASLVAANCA